MVETPLHFWHFCDRLKHLGANVLGVGDAPYDQLSQEVKASLTEYYYVTSLEDYGQVYNAAVLQHGRSDHGECQLQAGGPLRSRRQQDCVAGGLCGDVARSDALRAGADCMSTPTTGGRCTCSGRMRRRCGSPPSRSTTARGRPCPSCSCWSFARDDWSMKARVAARSISIRKRTLNTSTWILLICNGSAIHLYEAFGFVQIPGVSEQFVRGDYLMAKGG